MVGHEVGRPLRLRIYSHLLTSCTPVPGKEVNESHLQLLLKLYIDSGPFLYSCKFSLPCLTHLFHGPIEAHRLVRICWIECCMVNRHRALSPRKQHLKSSHGPRGCCSYQSMVVFLSVVLCLSRLIKKIDLHQDWMHTQQWLSPFFCFMAIFFLQSFGFFLLACTSAQNSRYQYYVYD